MITARQYSSGSEIIASAAAVRRRLLSAQPAPRTLEEPKMDPIAAEPLTAAPKAPELVVVRPWPEPFWKRGFTQFNQHIVDYLYWKISGELGEDRPAPRRSMNDIVYEALAKFPGVSMAEIKGPRRIVKIVAARQYAMYLLYKERTDISFPEIGRFFGKDHTTVLHAVRKLETLYGSVGR